MLVTVHRVDIIGFIIHQIHEDLVLDNVGILLVPSLVAGWYWYCL